MLTFQRLTLPSVALVVLVAGLTGCSSSPPPGSATPPPADRPPPGAVESTIPNVDPETGFTRIVAGAEDSVASIPGSAYAVYAYRFKQITPSSDRFTYQDRELSFYFKPTPAALHFQVENRTNRPVWIEWDRSTWAGTLGSEKIAHATTRYSDRYGTQVATQVLGLQRYSDYMFPISYLVDPAGGTEQLHRVLFPEDNAAIQYIDRVFGVDLVFRIDDRYVPYTFRFKVASVVPR